MLTEHAFRALGEATVKFANLKLITSAQDVERHFPWIRHRLRNEADDRVQMPDEQAAKIYTKEQAFLRRVLRDAIYDEERAAARIGRLLRLHRRPEHQHRLDVVLTMDGLDLTPRAFPGLQTAWLAFVHEVLTVRGRHRRLQQCNLWRVDECYDFIFKETAKTATRLLCCRAHEKRYGKLRQMGDTRCVLLRKRTHM